jgi:putative addiction module component (TIGR02574 family)
MSQLPAGFDIRSLSDMDKLELIEQLWDSLPESGTALAVPEWHKAELERRLASAEANPGAGTSWKEVQRRLRECP